MPKASLVLPNGTKVTIEGTTSEVAELLDHYSSKASGLGAVSKRKKTAGRKKSPKKRQPTGPTSLIRALIEEDYFKKRRTLKEIQAKLEEGGHIYAQTSLSPRLLELVKQKELRRLKENKLWVYVS